MLFLRKHTYLILGLLVGIVISGGVILLQRGQQQTSIPDDITPDVADQTPNATKPPPPGESKDSGFWHGDHWHKTSPTQLPAIATPKHNPRSQTEKNITLKRWRHHPHTSDHRTSPTLAELGLPQEKLDRIAQETDTSKIPDWDISGYAPDTWLDEMLQKRVNILTEDMDTISAFKLLKVLPDRRYKKYAREFAQRAIDENPDFLEGRLYLVHKGPDLARSAAEYRDILRDFPESKGALTGLGNSLAMDHPVEAIYHLKRANRIDPSAGLGGLGMAYQRIGDYKTAWTYYKKAQTYPHGPITDSYVKAIEAGTPIIQPLPLKGVKFHAVKDTISDVSNDFPQDTDTVPNIVRDDTGWFEESEETPPQFSHERETTDTERARAAAKQTHEDYLKYKERAQKEFNDFMQWAETIMNADAPMNTNNFLMKEMEAFLKGGKPQFEPERIIRAFEIIERYGPKEGIKRLHKNDPKVAAQVQRLLAEKRPHTPNNKGDNK